ncbi:c-type cytochrome [Terriglobus aquaticus]|uniref:C-type cytochrome n=1 Tax=Terriglobus aquaticus TaxID=940139 RepID=A0ABW9KKE5_9BACT|nr:cytochrome c [Terriglobus aquaticus]
MSSADNQPRRLASFLLGVVVTIVVLVLGFFAYIRFGRLPVATADPSFPMEAQIVHVPLEARIAREMQSVPFQADAQTYQAGAQIYVQQCASCHGTPGHDVAFASGMFPRTPQLWKKHANGVVGVSDDEPGETFWKVKNGIRLSGMPSYQNVLSPTQMWQVTLLLKDADKPLPATVQETLTKDQSPAAAPPATQGLKHD